MSNNSSDAQTELNTLLANYAASLVEGMDYEALECFAFDTVLDGLRKDFTSIEDLEAEILAIYDEETLADLKEK